MIAAGIGMRIGVSCQEIVALISRALMEASLSLTDIESLATLDVRSGEEGFRATAAQLGLPIIGISAENLRAVAPGVRTHSARVEALHGVGSVAEASALAAAGRDARLLLARISSERATCALAQGVSS